MIGQTLGHYRILEQIGAGGMGVVYRAHDERLDRDVAVKVLPPGALNDESSRKRFKKEALALAKLNHPNIASVIDFDTQGGVDFLVMEFIPGVTLSDKLNRGTLPEKEILRLGAQMVEGLAAAHGQNVVHRDLKPGNLRITPDGRLKVLDFGLAKLVRPMAEADVTASLTETHAVAGTLAYMAPEQLRDGEIDSRADIYSLGNVLYEMATGQRPFETTRTSTALSDAILNHPPVAPRSLNPRVSPELERIIQKCLEKEPENRYQSAKEIAVDLRRLGELPKTDRVLASDVRRSPRFWKVYAVGTAILVVVLSAVLAVLFSEKFKPTPGQEATKQVRSLAVLPLLNMSGSADQEYFADGMTEALITELSKISALKVISRTSVMQYKGTKKALPEVARELQVDGVIEGSVLRDGNQVRITVQLIHGPSDQHLWAQNYDREMRGILLLTSDVARAIAQQVRVVLTPQDEKRLVPSARKVVVAAQDEYLRGLAVQYGQAPSLETLKQKLDFFRHAAQLDPNFALAYSGIADTHLTTGDIGYVPPADAWALGVSFARKALDLDDSIAEAHSSLGHGLMHQFQWSASEQEFRRAIELNPGYAPAYNYLSFLYSAFGRFDEALTLSTRAAELDPLVQSGPARGIQILYYARRYDQTAERSRRVIESTPRFARPHSILGLALLRKGESEKAVAEIELAASLDPDTSEAVGFLGYAYAVTGQKEKARKILSRLVEDSKHKYVSQYHVALIQLALDQKETALTSLEEAYTAQSGFLGIWIQHDPALDPLRSDPRFRDIIRRMNFPQN